VARLLAVVLSLVLVLAAGCTESSRVRHRGSRHEQQSQPSISPSDLGPQASPNDGPFACTHVIGFSPTRQWFLDSPAFQSKVGDDRWQLLWNEGGGVEQWARPVYPGWSRPIDSPCADRSSDPDRVIFTIASLQLPLDPNAYAPQIQAVIAIIRQRYPEANPIVLQTVVGGPGGTQCANGHGAVVRSSAMQPVIVQAIKMVAGGDIIAGAVPDVVSCTDYADHSGHLEPDAIGPIGTEIAGFYAQP